MSETLKQFHDTTMTNPKPLGNYNGGYIGECVSGVQQLLKRVHNMTCGAWGNAIDYRSGGSGGNHLKAAGFTWYAKTSGMKDGDILVWGNDTGNWTGPYGHVAYWYGGKIISQNFNGHKEFTAQALFTAGLLGYWRPPAKTTTTTNPPIGGNDMIEAKDKTQLRAVMRDIKGWDQTNVDSGKYDASEAKAWAGKTWEEYMAAAVKEGAAYRTKRQAALTYYAKKAANDKALADAKKKGGTIVVSDADKKLAAFVTALKNLGV